MYGWKLSAIGYDLVCPPSILKIKSCSYKAGNGSSKTCGCNNNNIGQTCSEICKSSDACINRVNENDTDEDEGLLPGGRCG